MKISKNMDGSIPQGVQTNRINEMDGNSQYQAYRIYQARQRRKIQYMEKMRKMKKKRKQRLIMIRCLCGLGVMMAAGVIVWNLISSKAPNNEEIDQMDELNELNELNEVNQVNQKEGSGLDNIDTNINEINENNTTVNNNGVYHSDAVSDGDQNPYKNIYYYEADKQERYKAYAEKESSLPAGDVIWRVNANLDKPFYSDIQEIGAKDVEIFASSENAAGYSVYPYPLIINKYNKLPDDYAPENLVSLKSGKLATAETKEAFELMCADAENLGYTLNAVSGYRSIEYQKNLYNRYLQNDSPDSVDTYSARAGHSEHHTGRAIDISAKNGGILDFEFTAESDWVNENAYKYGFIIRYPKDSSELTGYKYEPWHITYVGTDISTAMKEKDIIILEEYVVKYISR